LSQLLAEAPKDSAAEAPVDAIHSSALQPRSRFDETALRELADSIRAVGILQPLVVRPIGKGRYELIAGERRLRAARMAGLKTVPILERSADHQASLELALIENIQREDITPLECARAYRRLIDEFDLTQEGVARKVGKSRPAVANTLRLLALPKRIQEGLQAGKISEGHARALLVFESSERQLAVYEQVVAQSLTVRDVEEAALRKGPKKASGPRARNRPVDPETAAIEQAISERLGSPARLARSGRGGRIVVEFYSNDDLERILETLDVRP
jgi:ParB family chromosome partitioning protein